MPGRTWLQQATPITFGLKAAGWADALDRTRRRVATALRAPGLVATMLGAMVQEHERGLGGWQAEWDTLPDLVLVSAGGARAVADALESLSVDTERMRANLDASGGTLLAESVAMALAESLGTREAHACVAAACRHAASERRPLADVLNDDPVVTRHLDRAEIARRLSPDHYLGVAHAFIARVLSRLGETKGDDV